MSNLAQATTDVNRLHELVAFFNKIVLGDADDDATIDGETRPVLAKLAASFLLGMDTYATVAEGLAGAGEGGFFQVVSDVDEEYTILYQDVNGVAVEKKRYPSYALHQLVLEARDRAEAAASSAETDAGTASVARDQSVAASEASGDVKFFDTKAIADAAPLVEGDIVEVFADETRDGGVARYRYESGSLVFKWQPGQRYVQAEGSADVRTQQEWAALLLQPNSSEVTANGGTDKRTLAEWMALLLNPNDATVTTSTGTQSLAGALDARAIYLASIDSLQTLALTSLQDGQGFVIKGYYPSSSHGGGRFYYDAALAKSEHDGAAIISPTVPWDGLESTQADFVAGTGETDGAGTGVFVALGEMTVERFGAVGDGGAVDTARVQAAADYGRVVSHDPSLNFLVGEVNAPQGCYVDGDATLTFSSGPISGVKLSVAQLAANNDACMFVHETHTLADLLQIKSLGYGCIMHYLQFAATSGSNGTALEVINNCEALGIKVILASQTDTPTLSHDDRDIIIGYYVFDEPQANGVSRADQDTRIDAHKALTDKSIYCAAHGEYSFSSDTISPQYDTIFFDPYYADAAATAQTTDLSNKANALVGYSELTFKCPNSKLTPVLGLFTSPSFSDKAKQIAFAKDSRGMAKGIDFAVFGWDALKITNGGITADVSSDADFLEQARVHCHKKDIQHWRIDCVTFLSSSVTGNGQLVEAWDVHMSSDGATLRPFYVENVGSLVNERQRDFEHWGIGVGAGGGNFVFRRPCLGDLYARIIYDNRWNGDTLDFSFVESNNDWYSWNTLHNAGSVSDGGSFRRHVGGVRGHQYGFNMTTTNSTVNRLKFINGYIINTDWTTKTF